MSMRWLIRLLLATLIVSVIHWSDSPSPYLAGGSVALILMLCSLKRRPVSLAPPWAPPWQASSRHVTWHSGIASQTGQTHRTQYIHALLRSLIDGARRWAARITALRLAIQLVVVRPKARRTRRAQKSLESPAQLSRPIPVASTVTRGVVAALTAATERALAESGVTGHVGVLESTRRSVTITLETLERSAGQTRQIRDLLRPRASSVRWRGVDQLHIQLPFESSRDVAQRPLCVPILRRCTTTLWWPLSETRPLILAGDAVPTLYTLLDRLADTPGLLIYDPEQVLSVPATAVDRWPAHSADALATACTHALHIAYCRTQASAAPSPSPLTLIVVAPDGAIWRDLAPLLAQPDHGGVRLIVALTAGASHPSAQDVCRRGQVVEIGGFGNETLPEACRPPGLASPRPGMVLAWQTPQRYWHGRPIRQA
jgi:hypothetical protein